MSGVVIGSNNITINGRIMEIHKYTFIEPTSSPSVTPIPITGTSRKYISFINTGANQTSYTITFPENTECDILIVGGGGAGGVDNGAGGGGGGVLHIQNIILNGDYIVGIGRGGLSTNASTTYTTIPSENGINSFFGKNGDLVQVLGGGYGGNSDPSTDGDLIGGNGGSGGGGAYVTNTGGTKTNPIYNTFITALNSTYYGGNGGNGGAGATYTTSGGGGAGGITPTTANGANGVQINIDGNNYFWGGGGGGSSYAVQSGNGGSGGGGGAGGSSGQAGSGGLNGINNGVNGTGVGTHQGLGGDGGENTGGGGGGCEWNTPNTPAAGKGGSGIIIIRYNAINEAQWTYSASNPNVYHLGNVGIGTINPTSALHVLGSVQVNGGINTTSLTATTKNFKIEHPLNINKWLYHGCVESPRFDNIYRGKKKIINGRGEVDIDEECNTTGGMTKGTFESLNTNFSLYLQNKSSYDCVKGSIKEGKIIINCENTEEEIEIDWLVIGERKDEDIKSNKLTNNEGKLICEHDMD